MKNKPSPNLVTPLSKKARLSLQSSSSPSSSPSPPPSPSKPPPSPSASPVPTKLTPSPSKKKSYHHKANRLHIGSTVYACIGKPTKKPNKKYFTHDPLYGRVKQSINTNVYKVRFLNGEIKNLKLLQLTMAPKNTNYDTKPQRH